jgi:hypothetical protein
MDGFERRFNFIIACSGFSFDFSLVSIRATKLFSILLMGPSPLPEIPSELL